MFSNVLSLIGLIKVHVHTLKPRNIYFIGDVESIFSPLVECTKRRLGLPGLKILRSLIKFFHSSSGRLRLFSPFYRQGDQILERCCCDTFPIQPAPASHLSSLPGELLPIPCSAPGSSVLSWEFLCRNDPTDVTDHERDSHCRISVRSGGSISCVSLERQGVPTCGP